MARYALPSRGLSPLKVLPAFPGARGVRRCYLGSQAAPFWTAINDSVFRVWNIRVLVECAFLIANRLSLGCSNLGFASVFLTKLLKVLSAKDIAQSGLFEFQQN